MPTDPHPPRALVTGSDGQLGRAFVSRLAEVWAVTGVDRGEIDLTRPTDLRQLVDEVRPSLIINCAAWNDVDGAETHPLDAFRTNGDVVWYLADLARARDATLVHFSSDFVFDGTKTEPHTEDDDPAPQSVYGMSKLAGERNATRAERHYVLRLASLYGGHTRRTSTDWFIERARAGERVTAFGNRTVSPSYVPHVVDQTCRLLDVGAPFGLYHAASADWCLWTDIAARILARVGKSDLLVPTTFDNPPDRAPRPQHCALSSAKLAAAIGPLPGWREALDDYLGRVQVLPELHRTE